VADIIIWLILVLVSILVAIPILHVIVSSFSATTDVIPRIWTVDAYRYVFSSRVLPRSLGVSIYITGLGTLISLVLTSLIAYGLSYRGLPGRAAILFLVVFTMLFNGGIIPTYLVVRATGLLNTLWAIMIPNAISAFNLVVLKNFFQNIPTELKESAKMDGAHELTVLWRIIVPLSVPALAVFGLFYAVARWNLYFLALLYISESEKWPVQVVLQQVLYASVGTVGEADAASTSEDAAAFTSQGIRSAVIIAATLPIAMVYPFLQKHFVKGLLVGSIKG
jgi:putative aldouronate transport system permease protein